MGTFGCSNVEHVNDLPAGELLAEVRASTKDSRPSSNMDFQVINNCTAGLLLERQTEVITEFRPSY